VSPAPSAAARRRPGAKEIDLPSTLERSDQHAQEIYSATLASAIEQYGDGERAHRTAFDSLKHSYERVGDHWESKAQRGPSDDRAAATGIGDELSHGGVDARASVAHLRDVARRLGIAGRSRMRKAELVDAIERANRRETARARQRN
jgi:cation transport regulator ChaB